MTKNQCMKRIKSSQKDIRSYILKETERLLNSGGVNLDDYEDEFLLPKVLLTVACKSLVAQYSPYSDRGKADVKNLAHF